MHENINSNTELYGVLGNPVNHSLSPLMHNAAFSRLHLNAVYLAFLVERPLLGLAFESVRSLGVKGVNITLPFKEEAVNFMDEIPEDIDRCIGALNTVVNRHGKLYGYNTDVPGFLAALKEELNIPLEGKSALVLGAGGAARSVVFALAKAHADQIFIHNRTPDRAEGLKNYLADFFADTEIRAIESPQALRGEKIDLVVNATACGMKREDPLPFDLKQLTGPAGVYDLVYSPSETGFLKEARRLGLKCANGLGMLATQGALSFELWTGRGEGVRDVMWERLKQCQF
ncbi:MAG: shikimate dehydrogenase [Candidatus Omnitrophica bacterium]|nr:shikimate dehydrogenase [Candidatus Omnitrophota bacterium]